MCAYQQTHKKAHLSGHNAVKELRPHNVYILKFERVMTSATAHLSDSGHSQYLVFIQLIHSSDRCPWQGWSLVDLEHLNDEGEGGVAGNAPRGEALDAIAVVGGHGELRLLANAHLDHALVPALNDLPEANIEAEGLVGVEGRPELLAVIAVLDVAGAVDGDLVATLGEGAGAGTENLTDNAHYVL